MRRNIALVVAFDGTVYSGWQRQKDRKTIQGELEAAVKGLTGEEVSVHGAGRTDAGVHALAMAASFITTGKIPAEGILRGMNSRLSDDIVVTAARDVDESFHPRKCARGKSYAYHLGLSPVALPTERLYRWQIPFNLDLPAIENCLGRIVGTHDFAAFEASGSRDPNAPGRGAVRTIFSADLVKGNGDEMIIRLTGDGFLRHMVRNIVGTLVEVGRGRISPEGFAAIVEGRDRSAAGPTAPARGLFLEKVFFGQEEVAECSR